MPWSNQGGGGGPWGGGSNGSGGGGGGPWGQGPRGGRPQGTPPDLEEIIRRGQDRLKTIIPGGGKGGSVNPSVVGLIILGLLGLWAFKAIYTIQPDELGVELRFGVPKDEVSMPGLHFHWWPIETMEKVVTAEKLLTIGDGGRRVMPRLVEMS